MKSLPPQIEWTIAYISFVRGIKLCSTSLSVKYRSIRESGDPGGRSADTLSLICSSVSQLLSRPAYENCFSPHAEERKNSTPTIAIVICLRDIAALYLPGGKAEDESDEKLDEELDQELDVKDDESTVPAGRVDGAKLESGGAALTAGRTGARCRRVPG